MPEDFGDLSAAPRGTPLAGEFTVSLAFDRRLYREEIAASLAHCEMLARVGIISQPDAGAIQKGLTQIRREISEGVFTWREDLEDIHMNVEARLYALIGGTAGKLHTARSRNDQTVTATRLFVMGASARCIAAVRNMQRALLERVETEGKTICPGYTHLQRAQPIRFGHHLLAYFEMLDRDAGRFASAYDAADSLPLGSGALAGVPYPIDRHFTARQLGFSRITRNSLDAVSDRDYIVSFIHASALCMTHLSRLAEEIILWMTQEFAFIRLPDAYTTGSSIMPQKRNPDFAEIIRGKSGRTLADLVGIHTVLKGLPLAYNRDLQEDKTFMFDAWDTTIASIEVMSGMVRGLQVNRDAMKQAAESGEVLATDTADYLAKKGVPFREAYAIAVKLWDTARLRGETLDELPFEYYREASSLFEPDAKNLKLETSVDARNVEGGTAEVQVTRQLQNGYGVLHESLIKDPSPPNV